VSEQHPTGWEPAPGQPPVPGGAPHPAHYGRPAETPNWQQPYDQAHAAQYGYAQPYQQPYQQPYASQYGQPQPYPLQYQPASGSGGGTARTAWIAAGIVALLAVIVTVVALVTSGGEGTPVASGGTTAATTTAGGGSEPDRSTPTAPSPDPGPGPESASPDAPVALGRSAPVGDYVVTIDAVLLDGDAIVAGANQFNEPPTGRYVIVEATAQYVGTTEGNPYWDLSYVFNGTDARQYADTECSAVLPNDAIDAPTLNPGGSASFQVCMDVAPAAIDGGVLFLEPLASFGPSSDRVFFAIR
jgi:hypothetical protein